MTFFRKYSTLMDIRQIDDRVTLGDDGLLSLAGFLVYTSLVLLEGRYGRHRRDRSLLFGFAARIRDGIKSLEFYFSRCT